MNRLLIFGDPSLGSAAGLLEAFLKEIRGRRDIEVLAACDCGHAPAWPAPFGSAVAGLRHLAKTTFNPPLRSERARQLAGFRQIARRYGVPVIVPPHRDVNDPAFIASLRQTWRPTLALSLGCRQVFREELLNVFELAVNYHDGLLPNYKGLRATAWSLYRGEQCTGYTYHLMNRAIDAGPTLLQNSIPVRAGMGASEIYREKTRRAGLDAASVLGLMVSRCEGIPQKDEGDYFSRKDHEEFCLIEDPSSMTAGEIQRRLYAFEVLNIRIHGRFYEVTAMRESGMGPSRLSFVTSDRRTLTPHRLMYLPLWLYRFYRLVRGTKHREA